MLYRSFKVISDDLNFDLLLKISKYMNTKIKVIKNISHNKIYIINKTKKHNKFKNYIIKTNIYPIYKNIMKLLLLIKYINKGSFKSIDIFLTYHRNYSLSLLSEKNILHKMQKRHLRNIISFNLHTPTTSKEPKLPLSSILLDYIFINFIQRKIAHKKDPSIIITFNITDLKKIQFYKKRLKLKTTVINKNSKSVIIKNIKGKKLLIIHQERGINNLIKQLKILKINKIKNYFIFSSNTVLSKKKIKKITKTDVNKIITIDNINHHLKILNINKLKVLSCAPIIAEYIKESQNQ